MWLERQEPEQRPFRHLQHDGFGDAARTPRVPPLVGEYGRRAPSADGVASSSPWGSVVAFATVALALGLAIGGLGGFFFGLERGQKGQVADPQLVKAGASPKSAKRQWQEPRPAAVKSKPTKSDEEAQARAEKEKSAAQAAEAKAKADAEAKAKANADAKARADAEAKARQEEERIESLWTKHGRNFVHLDGRILRLPEFHRLVESNVGVGDQGNLSRCRVLKVLSKPNEMIICPVYTGMVGTIGGGRSPSYVTKYGKLIKVIGFSTKGLVDGETWDGPTGDGFTVSVVGTCKVKLVNGGTRTLFLGVSGEVLASAHLTLAEFRRLIKEGTKLEEE
jgi:hypothetical protein